MWGAGREGSGGGQLCCAPPALDVISLVITAVPSLCGVLVKGPHCVGPSVQPGFNPDCPFGHPAWGPKGSDKVRSAQGVFKPFCYTHFLPALKQSVLTMLVHPGEGPSNLGMRIQQKPPWLIKGAQEDLPVELALPNPC